MPVNRPPEQLSFGNEFDPTPTHRLFFGIRPGAQATNGLMRLRSDPLVRGRLVDWDRMHGTLLALGPFAGRMPPDVTLTAQTAAAKVRARWFEPTFDYIAGNQKGLRLLASNGCPPFWDFLRTLGEALVAAGLRRHLKSTSNPHITLSYGGDAVPRTPVEPITWTVREFVLIESLIGKHQHIERGRWSIRP